MRPAVYNETTIVSYLTSEASNDIRVMANINATTEWWETRKPEFEIFVSEFVVAEASQGDAAAARRRMKVIDDIPELNVAQEARTLAKALISEGPIPGSAETDAYHIAVATVNGMDYLLTWNCSHIANAVMRPGVEAVCRNHGYEPPTICTPLELMEE